MRGLALVLVLAGCSQEAPEGERSAYAGQGRDRLCIAGERAGFITYGEGDTNCSVRGRIERDGGQPVALVPDGDEDCRITLRSEGGTVRLGTVEAACAYYCGPGASFADKAFSRQSAGGPAVDFGGDPLC